MSRRISVLVLGFSLIVASISGLVLITYRVQDRQIAAFIDLIPGSGCSISGLKLGPVLAPGSQSRQKNNALFWVSSDCTSYNLETSRRILVSSVNGAYQIKETPKGDNPFDTWKYAVRISGAARTIKVPLIVEVENIGKQSSFSNWSFDLGVRPATVKVTAYGTDDAVLRNIIFNDGDESKDVIATYVDSTNERIEQVLVIVLSALIGVGASAVFEVVLGSSRKKRAPRPAA